jgi:hypothetical protein
MDNLDTLKKLVSTRRTFSISILTGLDCREPQGYILCFKIGFKMGKKWGKFNFFSKSLDVNLDYLKKSWLSWWSRLVSTISIKILMQPSLNWKVAISKILTKKKKIQSWPSRKSWNLKKVGLNTKDILDVDWSRLSRPPGLNLIQNTWYIIHYTLHIILRMRESYKRFVKTWIRTVSWPRILTPKRFDSYPTIWILTLKDLFRIVSHKSSQFSKIHLFLWIQWILTNP